jgi:hypothetical protein
MRCQHTHSPIGSEVMAKSYNEQMQAIVSDYVEAGEKWPASSRDIAGWAVRNGRWEPQPATVINQCAEHLSRAMREEYITDPQGRSVRSKHVAKVTEAGKQTSLWADIRTAPREHMQLALQQRRFQVVGDCKQLKFDADSYNENHNKGESIQMSFDFTKDLMEIEAGLAATTK